MFKSPLLGLTRGHRLQIALLIGLGLAVTATFVAQAFIVAEVLTNIFQGKDWSAVLMPLVWILVLIGLRAWLVWYRELLARGMVERIKSDLRQELLAHLMDLGPGYMQRTRTGEIQPVLVDKVEALEGYLGNYFPQIFVTLLGSLAIGGYLLTVDWLVGLVVFGFMPVVLLAQNWSKIVMGEQGRATFKAFSAVKSDFIDNIQGMTTLKAFGASAQQGQYLEKKSNRLYAATMRLMGLSSWGSSIMGLATSGGTTLVVSIGAFHLAGGQLSVGQLMIILFLSGEAFRPVTDLARFWHSSYSAVSAYEGITRFLETKPEIDPGAAPAVPPALPARPEISFKQVTFTYKEGNRAALQDLSFTVGPGETVALVGRSGAGKTSVVSLLLRFFDPQAGEIKLAGKDLKEYDLATLRSMLAVVAQDTYLFYGTIADNLQMAKPGASQADLETAARAANAHDFIAALPQGYRTIIGERGTRLSGGERQRLAIARALLKDAPVLILDEATSSVDGASEAAIQEALERLMAGRTTLVIAHRLSTVIKADRIVVIENGTAVEAGRHSELLGRQTAYARLVAAQQEML
jgi:ATP-binding cassette, subfamily C, bacterial CydD